MGIPAFYRWLVERYPLSVVDVVEEEQQQSSCVNNSSSCRSKPNPNNNTNNNKGGGGMDFDNLYLDMNGIIHPCFHPENLPPPESYDEVFKCVFAYIDRIFSIVRPHTLLYLAIDGVAPRAKMNQQRARRFRAAKEAEMLAEEERLSQRFESEVRDLLAHSNQSKVLDSNVITPGTEFMAALSAGLEYYIHLRLNSDPGWRKIKVILSDANVPGEGEHKIMSYIRLQRNLPGFDPNTRHCLFGLDADLIMLALATHEIHFVVLREDVRAARQLVFQIPGARRQGDSGRTNYSMKEVISRQQFQFLCIWVLRDYLKHDMRIPDAVVDADLERLVDDFVFMCLFVGNDFLPHMPSLEISEGAIDLLITVYKKEFNQMGGYLTNSAEVDLKRVEHFVHVLGLYEDAIFRRRNQFQKNNLSKDQLYSKQGRGGSSFTRAKGSKDFWSSFSVTSTPMSETSQTCGENAVEMERQSVMYGLCTAVSVAPEFGGADVDKVKLGEPGWKERYYAEKFPAVTEDERKELIKDAVLKYTEGICWVMHYYYQGVCSWQWYYPYHYAPFASDFHGLDQIGIQFTLGVPFKPFTQLMGVLPAASAHALPISYQQLMADPMSPIADFYPSDFEVDMNGKRFAWQGIPKLPFIEEFRLLEEIAKVEHTLMDEEKQRNSVGIEILFVHTSHPLAMEILSLYRRDLNYPRLPEASVKEKIDFKISDGMNGYVYISDKVVCPPLIVAPVEGMENIAGSQVISVFYELPCVHAHVPRLPEGVIIPKKLVTKRDLTLARVLWHEDSALHGRVTLKRPVPNSVSGAYLGRLAHQLVKKFYKHQERESVTPANLKFAFSNVFGGLSKEMCTNGINNNNNTCGNKRTERECHSKDETEAKGVAPLKRTGKELEGTHKGSEYDGEIKMETESLPCGEKTREQANGMSKGSEYPDNGQMNAKRRRAWKQLGSAGKEGECNCSGRTEVRKREEANHMREMEYRDNGEMKAESLPCGEKATEQTNSMRKGSGEHSSSEMKAKRRRKRARKQADGPRKNGECKGISETEASTREEADGMRKEKEYHDNLETNTESQPCSEKTWEHVDGIGKESEYHSKNEMKAKSRRKRVMKEADGKKKDEDCNGNSETEARAREEANDVRKETEYYKNGELKTASLPCGEEARELEEGMRKGREYHRNSKAEAKRRSARKPSDGVWKEAGCKGNSEAESVRKRAWEEADKKEKEHHWNG